MLKKTFIPAILASTVFFANVSPEIVPFGLKNLGNTCFENASLQCLFGLYGFNSGVSNTEADPNSLLHKYYLLISNQQNYTLDQIVPIISKQIMLSQEIWKDLAIADPSDFTNCVRTQLKLNSTENGTYHPQEDAAEFLTKFLDSIFTTRPYLQHLFGINIESTLTCPWGHQSIRPEILNMITLELNPKKLSLFPTLQECLVNYQKPESLDGDNQSFCERCNRKVDTEKQLNIENTSQYLIIQLKRFEVTGEHPNFRQKKINRRIIFPLENLSINGRNYSLNGIVFHSGICGGGHYTAVSKRFGRWYSFNDTTVRTVTNEYVQAISNGTASFLEDMTPYILFYEEASEKIEPEPELRDAFNPYFQVIPALEKIETPDILDRKIDFENKLGGEIELCDSIVNAIISSTPEGFITIRRILDLNNQENFNWTLIEGIDAAKSKQITNFCNAWNNKLKTETLYILNQKRGGENKLHQNTVTKSFKKHLFRMLYFMKKFMEQLNINIFKKLFFLRT